VSERVSFESSPEGPANRGGRRVSKISLKMSCRAVCGHIECDNVLTPEETRELLDSMETDTLIGLRDRAVIALLMYSFRA
jgi:hypothetical protein